MFHISRAGLDRLGGSYFRAVAGVTAEVAGELALSAAFAPTTRDLFGDLGAGIGTGDALRRPGMAAGGGGLWARAGGTFHDGEAGEASARSISTSPTSSSSSASMRSGPRPRAGRWSAR